MARMAISGAAGTRITLHGKQVVSFGGCNYLGLSHHPDVLAAMARGLAQFGISTTASRETTGNTTVHDRLEDTIREFLGVESVVVVPDGYTANLAAAQAIAGTHRVAVVDERCHRSIREALACAGIAVREFRHLDAAHARELLSEMSGLASLWTDGVFASDGSVAPVAELGAACGEFGAMLVVDDCHGLMTLGRGGRGTLSSAGMEDYPDAVITSTLAKGVGCHGGFVAGTNMVGDMVRDRATAYMCTTPVSPAIAAAAIEAFEVVKREPERVDRLSANARRLLAGLREAGVRVQDCGAPVFAFTLATERDMKRTHEEVLANGFLAPLIRYPDGPAPVYFRVSVTASHTKDEIDGFCAVLARVLAGCATAGA